MGLAGYRSFVRKYAQILSVALALCIAAVPMSVTDARGALGRGQVLDAVERDSLDLILLEVSLDGEDLGDVLNAYQDGDDILLPMGDLSHRLTLGLTVDPVGQGLSGFILREDNTFRIDTNSATVFRAGRQEGYDRRQVRWIDGDVYVASRLVQAWLPIDLQVNMASLKLKVFPRQTLPIQARLQRERDAERLILRKPGEAPSPYPLSSLNYRLLDVPFIDNSVTLDIRHRGKRTVNNVSYSGFATGDLLGMEAAGYFAISRVKPRPDIRLSLARYDPDGRLLGPLGARSLVLGNVSIPALKNVLRGSGNGNGLLLSNRPLNQSSSYGLQTLRGELPPGWDVTLYFNEALIGFQQSRADGLYEFSDQALVFGRNEFVLIFQGPLGQRRTERQVYQLDQMLTKPGEFYYTFGGQIGNGGRIHQTAQLDYGLMKRVGLSLGQVYSDNGRMGGAHTYLNAGVKVAAFGSLINIDHVRDLGGGYAIDLGIKTAVRGVSIDASRVWANAFQSDALSNSGTQLNRRDKLRLTGVIGVGKRTRLPYALDLTEDRWRSGFRAMSLQQRLSLNRRGTNYTSMLDWQRVSGSSRLDGGLQISRRVAGIGLNGQINYGLRPDARLQGLAFSASKTFGDGRYLNLGIAHDFKPDRTLLSADLNRDFRKFAIGVGAIYGGPRDYGVGIRIFTALGRDPRSGRVTQDWRPGASMGAVSARAFVDRNQNGLFDQGEEPIERAGFAVNGASRSTGRTGPDGVAWIGQLQPKTYADISVDMSTLDDAQWQPAMPGVRVLPRAGKVQTIDFPILLTAEIDGTVYFEEGGIKRAIGNTVLELVDQSGRVVSTTRSASDGYYLIPGVKAGAYQLRVSPDQLAALDLVSDDLSSITINTAADFVTGVNFTVKKAPKMQSLPAVLAHSEP